MRKLTRVVKVFLPLLMLQLAYPPVTHAALVDNGDGTVTDTVTGLMWDQCSQGQTGAGCSGGSVSTLTWADALVTANTANTGNYKGHSDWRLPNKNELESIILITAANPAIDLIAFPGTAAITYWSSTTITTPPTSAWSVNFGNGLVDGNAKTALLAMRLVRGGQ